MNLFYVEIRITQSDHLNSSYGIFMPTSRFTDFSEEQFEILISQCLVSIFDSGYLCSFKAKVLRVHFQLESPKSEHRNSTYIRINREYSIVKLMQEIACTWPHFECIFELSRVRIWKIHIKYVWFSLKSMLIGHLNHSNRIINEKVMAKIQKLVEIGKPQQVVPVQV